MFAPRSRILNIHVTNEMCYLMLNHFKCNVKAISKVKDLLLGDIQPTDKKVYGFTKDIPEELLLGY